MSLVLSAAELAEITKRDRPKWQARVLRALGVPFAVHPIDATLLVDREAARAVLGVKIADGPRAPAEVNIIALRARRHAKEHA